MLVADKRGNPSPFLGTRCSGKITDCRWVELTPAAAIIPLGPRHYYRKLYQELSLEGETCNRVGSLIGFARGQEYQTLVENVPSQPSTTARSPAELALEIYNILVLFESE